MDMSKIQVCTRCVLPSTFPGISFDEEGVCNHCRQYEAYDYSEETKLEHKIKFLQLAKKLQRTDGGVDALIAYSGGKDSTYTIYVMKELYGLNVAAFTFDNYFISPQATTNIKTVCERLDVPHVMIRHEEQMIKKVFAHASNNDMYAAKHMERASTICTVCSGFFKSVALMYALENRIPMIGYGWSPGQAPIASALTQANPKFVRMSQRTASTPIYKVVGETDGRKYFLKDWHYSIPAAEWPYNVHPLAWEPYSEEGVKEKIRELGWVDPTDVDSNSTNCMLNAWANEQHVKRYQFHPYVMEKAQMVRAGVLDRQEAYDSIYNDQNERLIEYALTRLDLK